MYESWKIKRWETPVADVKRFLMVSLTDTSEDLVLLLEAAWLPGRPRWSVTFNGRLAYRNIDEAYRLALWRHLDETNQRCGETFVVDETPRLASWHTGHLADMYPEARHFVVATLDDVIEVLADGEPEWRDAPAAAADEAVLPGRRRNLFFGEDTKEIDRIDAAIEAINRGETPDW